MTIKQILHIRALIVLVSPHTSRLDEMQAVENAAVDALFSADPQPLLNAVDAAVKTLHFHTILKTHLGIWLRNARLIMAQAKAA